MMALIGAKSRTGSYDTAPMAGAIAIGAVVAHNSV